MTKPYHMTIYLRGTLINWRGFPARMLHTENGRLMFAGVISGTLCT
jgi:hypothetical protein